MASTRYTDRELRREAVNAIHDDAKAAGCRAACVGFDLVLTSAALIGTCTATLVAHGRRTDDGTSFVVNIAI